MNRRFVRKIYFPEEMLKEIQEEATRQDRPLLWIVKRAWSIARKDIMSTKDESLTVHVRCIWCEGTGFIPETGVMCHACGGLGW